MGFKNALELYMGDFTFSSYACLQAGAVCAIAPTFVAIKSKALAMSKAMGAHPFTRKAGAIKPPVDFHRWERESAGMSLCGKSGSLFANVKNPKVKSKQQE